MHRTLKICLVCAAWAAIGTQVALSFSPSWLALITGLVLGSLGGYLTCDWRRVVWATPIAWRRATSWRPDPIRLLKNTAGIGLMTTCIAMNALPWMLLFSIVPPNDKGLQTFIWIVFIPMLTVLSLAIPVVTVNESWWRDEKGFRESPLGILAQLNIVVFTFVALVMGGRNAIKLLGKAIRSLPSGIQSAVSVVCIAGRFTWHLYRLIHTEERWLCSVDIACGVALGYWFASPLIGGASGAAFWLVNRLLIAGYCLQTLPVRVK